MLNRIVKSIKENGRMEDLERRTAAEWLAEGTVEEAAKLAEYKKRKARNNLIAQAVGLGVALTIVKLEERKLEKELKEA